MSASEPAQNTAQQCVLRDTQAWLQEAVIGLNLCPFAKKVWREGRVRLSVYGGQSQEEALGQLGQEITRLSRNVQQGTHQGKHQGTHQGTHQGADPVFHQGELHSIESSHVCAKEEESSTSANASTEETTEETTLFILPHLCADFWDFLSLVQAAQRVLKAKHCVGLIQIAHFHPEYQFAHTQVNDPENYINRSPYPTLHLLREEDIEWAALHHPDVSQIYQNNVARLNEMGHAGWAQLGLQVQGKLPRT